MLGEVSLEPVDYHFAPRDASGTAGWKVIDAPKDSYAKGPNVDGRCVGSFLAVCVPSVSFVVDFRRKPGLRAAEGGWIAGFAREAKVPKFDTDVARVPILDQDIIGFDVSMYDRRILSVEIGKRRQTLTEHLDAFTG